MELKFIRRPASEHSCLARQEYKATLSPVRWGEDTWGIQIHFTTELKNLRISHFSAWLVQRLAHSVSASPLLFLRGVLFASELAESLRDEAFLSKQAH